MANVGIVNSWSLREFRDKMGAMKVTDDLVNSETGETFKSCAFRNGGKVTMVGFSSNLSEINTNAKPEVIAKKIVSMVDDLQVVELESGNYKLCKAGADTWASVDF